METPKRPSGTLQNEQFTIPYESPEFRVGWDDGFGTLSRPNKIKIVNHRKSNSPGLISRNFRTQKLKASCIPSPRTENIDSHPDSEEFLNWVETILLDKPDQDSPPSNSSESPCESHQKDVDPVSTPTKGENDLASSAFEKFINSPTPSYKRKSKPKESVSTNSGNTSSDDFKTCLTSIQNNKTSIHVQSKSFHTVDLSCDNVLSLSNSGTNVKSDNRTSNKKNNRRSSNNKATNNNSRRNSIDSNEYFNDSINDLMVQCSQMVEEKEQNGEYKDLLDDSANDMILACTQQVENQLTNGKYSNQVNKIGFNNQSSVKKMAKKHFLSPNQQDDLGGKRKKLCLNNNEVNATSMCLGVTRVKCESRKEDISSFLNEDEDMLCSVDIDEIVSSQQVQPIKTNPNVVTNKQSVSSAIIKTDKLKSNQIKTIIEESKIISDRNLRSKSDIGLQNSKLNNKYSNSRNSIDTNSTNVGNEENILEAKNIIRRIKEKSLSENKQIINSNQTSIQNNTSNRNNKHDEAIQDLINNKFKTSVTTNSHIKNTSKVNPNNNVYRNSDSYMTTRSKVQSNVNNNNNMKPNVNNTNTFKPIENNLNKKSTSIIEKKINDNKVQPKYTQEQIALKKIEAKRRQALLRLKQKSFENVV